MVSIPRMLERMNAILAKDYRIGLARWRKGSKPKPCILLPDIYKLYSVVSYYLEPVWSNANFAGIDYTCVATSSHPLFYAGRLFQQELH